VSYLSCCRVSRWCFSCAWNSGLPTSSWWTAWATRPSGSRAARTRSTRPVRRRCRVPPWSLPSTPSTDTTRSGPATGSVRLTAVSATLAWARHCRQCASAARPGPKPGAACWPSSPGSRPPTPPLQLTPHQKQKKTMYYDDDCNTTITDASRINAPDPTHTLSI